MREYAHCPAGTHFGYDTVGPCGACAREFYRLRAETAFLSTLHVGDIFSANIYGRTATVIARKINRKTIVVDGLRTAQPSEIENRDNGNAAGYLYPAQFETETLVLDSSVTWQHKIRASDVVFA
jgi:hypothetical protein